MRSAFQLGCRLGRCAKTNHERKDRDEGHAGQGWVSGMNRIKEQFEWNEEKREQKGGKAAFMGCPLPRSRALRGGSRKAQKKNRP